MGSVELILYRGDKGEGEWADHVSGTPQSAQAAPICHFNILILCLKNGFHCFKKSENHSSR